MGNCCTATTSSMEWAGEDWGSLTSKNKRTSSIKVFDEGHELNVGHVEKERLLGALRASSDASGGKVTLKISKKDLEELLGGKRQQQQQQQKKPQGQLSAEQVLVWLMNARDHVSDQHHAHHRHWRPALQSIPEVN